MCILEPMKIDLKGLKEGLTEFQFGLDDGFFKMVDAQEVNHGTVQVTLSVQRTADVFTLDFHTEGTVEIPCDLCLDDMEQPIAADSRMMAKFGDDKTEEDEVTVVPESDGVLDVSWFIYESIALAIPIKHVHAPGKCNVAMTKKLEELSAARSSDGEDEELVDPRWEALKQLKV